MPLVAKVLTSWLVVIALALTAQLAKDGDWVGLVFFGAVASWATVVLVRDL